MMFILYIYTINRILRKAITIYSASSLNSSSVNTEILLIQAGDYGPCWASCIYTLYLRQIHK